MFECRSLDFKTIWAPFRHARSKVLCVAIVTSWSWMGLWRHFWHRQWLGWVHYTDQEWDLRMECPLRFTSYFVLLFIILYSMLWKGLRMVASVLWRSEVLRVGPWLRPKTYRVSDQGTTLRASDLHNAQAAIFNPFTLLVLFHTEANKTPFLYQNRGVIQYYFVFCMWTLCKYTIVRRGCFRKEKKYGLYKVRIS